MTEVWFYHLQRRTLEDVLPGLVERGLARGWKAVIQAGSAERMAALDDHLWTCSDDSFIPHVTEAEPDAAENPVVLVTSAGNPNGARLRFLVDGSVIPEDARSYERIMLVFDGGDPQAVSQARAEWTKAKAAGFDIAYWQQDAAGRWEKKA